MDYPFVIVDVFTQRAFGGNQLAVFPDARGLSDCAMQALTREFNFAESTFVLPPEQARHTRRVRIFTPSEELPFAGHPTVGTAAVLAHLGLVELRDGAGELIFEEGVGPVAVSIERREGALFTRLTLQHAVDSPSERPDVGAIAAALSLEPARIVDAWYAGTGVRFCFVQLAAKEDVDRSRLDHAAWARGLASTWSAQLYFFAGELRSGGRLYARMFAPGFGVDEDAATGSAAAALIGSLALRAREGDATVTLDIEQGVKMGRPSYLQASSLRRGGRVHSVSVGGGSVIVAQGAMTVPDGL